MIDESAGTVSEVGVGRLLRENSNPPVQLSSLGRRKTETKPHNFSGFALLSATNGYRNSYFVL